jgi:hypothetical protein
MSTGLNCTFVEVEPAKWYYLLEQGSAPKQTWDWREYADAYGPFETYEAASEHLRDNHANPGGHSTERYTAGREPDEVLKGLIESAQPPDRYRW